jgi:hypothetical protein
VAQLFSNQARALLTSAITEASTSFTVETALSGSFPVCSAPDFFKVVLQDASGQKEIVIVGRRDPGSDIMQSVIRGAEGTTPKVFNPALSPTVVALRMTAADIADAVNHVTTATGAHTAGSISFAQTDDIAAINVQGAIEEVRADALAAVADLADDAALAIDFVSQTYNAFTTSGTAPDFKISPPKPLTAYAPFTTYMILAHADGSLTASTLNVSLLGAKALKQYDADGVKQPAVIKAGMACVVVYDGTDFVVSTPLPTRSPDLPGDVKTTFSPTKPVDVRRILLTGNGQAIPLASFPTLGFLWCGSSLNNHVDTNLRADFFYRCVDPSNPDVTRSESGAYLKLPPAGFFMRALNTATTGGLDVGRGPYKLQDDDNKSHNHWIDPNQQNSSGTTDWGKIATGNQAPEGVINGFWSGSSGGAEARPKNIGVYIWICY